MEVRSWGREPGKPRTLIVYIQRRPPELVGRGSGDGGVGMGSVVGGRVGGGHKPEGP